MNSTPARKYGRYIRYLYVAISALLLLHWITVLTTYGTQEPGTTIEVLFDLDRERNVPTFFNGLLLSTNAILCMLLAFNARHKLQRVCWGLFALFFAYLALDEVLIIHEQLAEPTRKLLDITSSSPLYHAWVIPALVVILIMTGIIWSVRRYHKQLMVFSDTLLYVVITAPGVVLFEIIGTFIYPNNFAYRMFMVPLEEVFELTMFAFILSRLYKQLSGVKLRN